VRVGTSPTGSGVSRPSSPAVFVIEVHRYSSGCGPPSPRRAGPIGLLSGFSRRGPRLGQDVAPDATPLSFFLGVRTCFSGRPDGDCAHGWDLHRRHFERIGEDLPSRRRTQQKTLRIVPGKTPEGSS